MKIISLEETNWQFLLDRDLDNHYVLIPSRIQQTKKPGEYDGYLEITAMALIIKSPIEVYQVRGNDLHLLARLPTEAYGTIEPVRIAYSMDKHVYAGHFDLIVVLDKHDTSYSGTVSDNAVMLGDIADDYIKNLPLAYVIDPCSQSSSLSSDDAATSHRVIQTSSDPAASRELTYDVDTGSDSDIPVRASQSTDSRTSLDSASQNDSWTRHYPRSTGLPDYWSSD